MKKIYFIEKQDIISVFVCNLSNNIRFLTGIG